MRVPHPFAAVWRKDGNEQAPFTPTLRSTRSHQQKKTNMQLKEALQQFLFIVIPGLLLALINQFGHREKA